MTIKQTAGHDALGEFAPEFAHLNDEVLFGEVWNRDDKLPLKLRSIVTVSALIGKGIVDSSLKYHLQSARNNGVTKSEMAEILTHIAFYAGWPNAWAAFHTAKEVYADEATEAEGHGGFFGLGEPNDAFAQYFIGQSYLKALTCVEGEGWYQEEGKPARSLKPGDVVEIPANVKHWHGAKANCWFSHLAFSFPGENCSNEWLEPVDDEQYAKLDR